MEILNGQPNTVTCPYCKSLIKYEQKDKKGDYEFTAFGTVHWEYIICPKCNREIQF